MPLVSWRANSTIATRAWRLWVLTSALAGGMCWAGAGAARRLPSALQRENRRGCGGEAAGKRRAEHPFHLPAAGPARARASAPLHYCSLRAPAWFGRYSHPACRFPTYGFSAFFCPKLLGITQGGFSKESFPWQERDPTDALPARTRHLHRHRREVFPGIIPTWVQS